LQAAEEIGACVFVHPWDMQRDGRMSKFWLPWLVGMPSETAVAICSMAFGGVFERFPKLRVCFAHGGQLCVILWSSFNSWVTGGAFPYLVGRVEHGYNVRPDLCATENPFNPR